MVLATVFPVNSATILLGTILTVTAVAAARDVLEPARRLYKVREMPI